MRTKLQRGAWIALILTTSAFGQLSAPPVNIQLDPALNSVEREALQTDLAYLADFPLNGKEVRYFDAIFGGTTGADVLRYVDERVNWIVASTIDLDQAVVPLEQTMAEGSSPLTVASNIGTAIWFEALSDGVPGLNLKLAETTPIRITSSRAGVIRLGKEFATLEPLIRTATLVHEARHSDCTGGISIADVNRIRSRQLPMNRACGHIHSICPAGHDYAGLAACDDHPWGAYAVEADYLVAVTNSCAGCTLREKNLALALFADSASRVLDLEEMLAGKLGEPDMLSAEVQP